MGAGSLWEAELLQKSFLQISSLGRCRDPRQEGAEMSAWSAGRWMMNENQMSRPHPLKNDSSSSITIK